ncbi:hypothetical protein K8R03_00245 [Candidatus Kaiserbacteria bacterium]|nr:hypothetical protein [Candidatus Kaiserbacteria bacterium]
MRIIPFTILVLVLLASLSGAYTNIMAGQVPFLSVLIGGLAIWGLVVINKKFPKPFSKSNSQEVSSPRNKWLRIFFIGSLLLIPSPFVPALICHIQTGASECGAYSFLGIITFPLGLILAAIFGFLLTRTGK